MPVYLNITTTDIPPFLQFIRKIKLVSIYLCHIFIPDFRKPEITQVTIKSWRIIRKVSNQMKGLYGYTQKNVIYQDIAVFSFQELLMYYPYSLNKPQSIHQETRYRNQCRLQEAALHSAYASNRKDHLLISYF